MISFYYIILLMLFIFFLFIILFNILNSYLIKEGYLGLDNLSIAGAVPQINSPFSDFRNSIIHSEFNIKGGRSVTNRDIFGEDEVEEVTVISGDKDIREQDSHIPNEDGSPNYEWLCNNKDYSLGKRNHYTLMVSDSDKYTPEYISKNATYCKKIKKKPVDDKGSKESGRKMQQQAKDNKDRTEEQKNRLENASKQSSSKAGVNAKNMGSLPATTVK